MLQEEIIYKIGGESYKGFLACLNEKPQRPLPAILIAHAWRGRDDFACEKARALASLGYVAMAADLYGHGKVAQNDEEAEALMLPLFTDRALLQSRIKTSFEVFASHPLVDKNRMGAIGFCFRGLTVIELLRSGAPVKGVVSFHGVLGDDRNGIKAKRVPIAKDIKGSLLILHGHDDPLVSKQDIDKIQTEMTTAKVDWQMNIYSHTTHAFTNPSADSQEKGKVFQPRTNQRAWLAMNNFFQEIL